MDHIDLLLECGFNKPLFKVQLEDKTNVIQTVTLHKVILASLAELSQFREGLSALGVSKALKENPHLLRYYYCCSTDCEENVLTSGKLNLLFCIHDIN